MIRVVAIIQARMGSTRLPGKVLADISGGCSLLWHVVHRTKLARGLDAVVVATPKTPADEAIAHLCQLWDVPCLAVAGEDDVLGRYRAAAESQKADVIVRITADCPFIDPRLIDAIVWAGLERQVHYSSNVFPFRTFPDGLDVEVFGKQTLAAMDAFAVQATDREHVTPLLQRTIKDGQFAAICHDPDLGHLRWTVDTDEDLAFVREVYRRLSPRWDFAWDEVLKLGEFAHRRAA
jgi:spore coat polysaccharide biosynthesis protein SpsF (cytidylyltransferase family)